MLGRRVGPRTCSTSPRPGSRTSGCVTITGHRVSAQFGSCASALEGRAIAVQHGACASGATVGRQQTCSTPPPATRGRRTARRRRTCTALANDHGMFANAKSLPRARHDGEHVRRLAPKYASVRLCARDDDEFWSRTLLGDILEPVRCAQHLVRGASRTNTLPRADLNVGPTRFKVSP